MSKSGVLSVLVAFTAGGFPSHLGSVALAGGPQFESSGVELLGWVDLSDFDPPQERGSDIWAYVSPSGREYAIVGLFAGTGFVEVTDPTNPTIVGYVAAPGSIWRDMKVHGTYCYTVSEQGDGLQIIDLSNIDAGTVTHVTTHNLGGGFFRAHNIAYNPDSEYLYPVLSDLTGGIAALEMSNPIDPVVAGMWTDVGVHDVHVVTYTEGPNAGREIAFALCQSDGIYIVDVTDKSNMFTISSMTYPNLNYSHQGWVRDDKKYLFAGDELDELNTGAPTSTLIVDIQDLTQPFLLTTFGNGGFSIDHNLFVRGDFVFEANYSSGLRIFDAGDVNNVVEAGFFDSFPEDNNVSFNGAWASYPFLPSRIVLLSDRERGLFVLDTSEITGDPVPGDFDGDGDADLFDFEQLLGCVTGPLSAGIPMGCEVFDFDQDTDVDWADHAVFQLVFTGP